VAEDHEAAPVGFSTMGRLDEKSLGLTAARDVMAAASVRGVFFDLVPSMAYTGVMELHVLWPDDGQGHMTFFSQVPFELVAAIDQLRTGIWAVLKSDINARRFFASKVS
jgi:hypothetical protein